MWRLTAIAFLTIGIVSLCVGVLMPLAYRAGARDQQVELEKILPAHCTALGKKLRVYCPNGGEVVMECVGK